MMPLENPPDDKLKDFVKTQLEFLKQEEECERTRLSRRHALTARAIAFEIDEDIGPLVRFSIVSSSEKVKKGERLAATAGSKKTKRGTVYEIDKNSFTLSVKNTKFFPIGHLTDFCRIPCGNSEMQQAMRDIVIREVYKTGEPPKRVRDVLLGLARPRASPQVKPVEFFNSRLDKSQKEAVIWCLRQKEVAVIHGPPGTGKSTTLVELVKQAMERGEKVLVCAASNAAVDNLLDKVKKAGCSDLVRIGHPANMEKAHTKLTLESLARKKKKPEAAILKNAKVVFGTLTGCAKEVCNSLVR